MANYYSIHKGEVIDAAVSKVAEITSTAAQIDAVATAGVYTLPIASASKLGGIKVGKNLTISSDGVLDAVGGDTSSLVTLTTDQTISGTKTFTSEIKTNQITNENDNAMVRYNATSYKIVFGNSSIPTVIMGSGERPYYSSSGSDFVGVPLALFKDINNNVATQTTNGLMSSTDKKRLDNINNVTYEIDDVNLTITLSIGE